MATIQVLLVEDNLSDLKLTTRALKETQVPLEIHSVRNGADAVSFLFQKNPFENSVRPHIILLDLNLPGIDGREVLSTIKQSEHLKTIPVVALSTSSYEQDIEYCMRLGCVSYLVKPSHFEEFSKLVEKIAAQLKAL